MQPKILLIINIGEFLTKYLPHWRQVGRVCFHLAENKQDPDYPFAFLATYAKKLMNNSRIQYQPLNKALQEYAGESNKKALANLLQPISAFNRYHIILRLSRLCYYV